MEDTQGAVVDPSATPTQPGQGGQGGQQPASAGVSPGSSADPSAAPGQGGNQGELDYEAELRRLQSLGDQRLAENYRLQQELAALRQTGQAQPQQQQNPHDFNTDYVNWHRWENQQAADRAAQNTARNFMEGLMNVAKQQSELQWQAAHSDVDINAVKAWASANGVTNLDHAYTLMRLPQTLQSVTNNAQRQTLQQFRQPTGAASIRGGATANPPTSARFEDYLKAYNADPTIEDRWSPEEREVFWREVNVRKLM